MDMNPASQVLGAFVPREQELSEIRRAFRNGAQAVVIVGQAGTGKTALARFFAAGAEPEFPGGILTVSASPLGESPEDVLAYLARRRPREAKLLIIDDAEELDEVSLRSLADALQFSPGSRLILTSRHSLPLQGAHTITLGELNRRQFMELLRLRNAFAHAQLDEQTADRLFALTGGRALFADLAAAAVDRGLVASWAEIMERLQPFHTSGLVAPDGRPLTSASAEYGQVIADVSSVNAEVFRILKGRPETLWMLSPRQFEELVAEILTKQGYEVTLTPASGDGGLDIYPARKDALGKFLYLVECKRYVPPNKVGVEIVRALYGVVQAQRATAGAIVTTSFFTAGAEEFQQQVQHQLHLHDYMVLQRWIGEIWF